MKLYKISCEKATKVLKNSGKKIAWKKASVAKSIIHLIQCSKIFGLVRYSSRKSAMRDVAQERLFDQHFKQYICSAQTRTE
jgi:hypothetical protein